MAQTPVAHVPLAPTPRGHPRRTASRRPLFYFGWWIVAGSIVAQFVAMGQNQVTNVILGPMTQELGWTRSEFTWATTIGTLLSGGLGFVVGAQVDRRGARPLLIAGTIISSVALILTAYVQELWQFWALRGVALVLGNVMIGNLVVNVTISKWFVDRRGWAIAMAALGVSGWSVLGTQLVGFVVDSYGWRAAWTAMGFGTWILLPVAMLMSRQPEDHGLLPDGRREEDADSARGRASLARAQADFDNSLTRGEAARTPALWLLVLAFGLALTGMTALFTQLIQFFVDVGFTPSEARNFYSIQGGASLAAKFVWGAAMQRLPAKALVATSFTMAGAATLGLVYTASSAPWIVVAGFSAMWGLATGGMIPLSEFVWASYFGRRHIGAVRGLGLPFTVLLTSGGPLFASQVFDRTGSYNLAMVIFAGMWFVGALLIIVARKPQPRSIETVPLAHRLRPAEGPSASLVATHASMAAALTSPPSTDESPPADVVRRALFSDGAPRGVDYLHTSRTEAPASEDVPDSTLIEFPRSPAPGRGAAAGPDRSSERASEVDRVRPRRPTRSYMTAPEPRAPVDEMVAPVVEVPATPLEAFAPPVADLPDADGEPPTVLSAPEDAGPPFIDADEPEPAAPRVDGGLIVPAPVIPVKREPLPPQWVPRSTSEAILAGVVTSLVATAALWFLTRPGGGSKS